MVLLLIGKLRRKTDLEPVKRNVTRWSSTYEMLKRFFQIKDFVDDLDPDLACHLPSGYQTLLLKKILQDLSIFDNVSKQLQDQNCTLSEVRILFDAIINAYPGMEHYLAPNSHIVHSKNFESGIVKVIDEQYDQLSPNEKECMSVFQTSTAEEVTSGIIPDNIDQENSALTFVQKALMNKRRKVLNSSEYANLAYIPPTSNIVERLFSSCRLVLTDYRKSMTPYTFECVMFLKVNRSYWDMNLVAKVVGKSAI